VLGRVVVEREQLLQVTGDLRGRLRELRPIGGLERPGGSCGVLLILGAPDLGESLLRARMGRLRQRSQDVSRFVKP
jgi:hypothetical protein